MALTMRPMGLGSGIDKERQDYTVYTGGWNIGRIYEVRGGPENLRWFWSLGLNGPMKRSDRVATLEEAKAQFQTRSPGPHCRSVQPQPGCHPLPTEQAPDGDLRIEIVAVLQRRARATLASREHAPVHRIAPKPTRHATPGRARSPGARSIASITNCLAPAAPLRSEHRLGALCTLPAGASAPGSSFRRSN
jgi:hypothetical protein